MEAELLETDSVWKPARLRGSLVDRDETADLYKKVRSILNKLTRQNFHTLVQQLQALPINNSERMHGVIDLLFEKAISEPMYSVMYAQVCKMMSNVGVVDDDEDGQPVIFRKLLLNRCQHEFEKSDPFNLKRDERLAELESCTDRERKRVLLLEFEEMERQSRMKSVGNVRFIGELFKLGMLTSNVMRRCIRQLLKRRDEVSLECLCVLLTTIGKDLERRRDLSEYFEEMEVLSKQRGQISFYVRFMLQEVIELRDNKWVSKRDHSVPETVDQIQREAERELTIEVLMLSGVEVRDDDRRKCEDTSGARQHPHQRKYLHLPSSGLRIKVSDLTNVALSGSHQCDSQLRDAGSDSDSELPVTSDAPTDLQEASTEEDGVALPSLPYGKQDTSSDTEYEEVRDTGHSILSAKNEERQMQTEIKTTPLESTESECGSEAQAPALSPSESCNDAAVESDVSDGDMCLERAEENIQLILEDFLSNNNIQESMLSISAEFPPSDRTTFVVGAVTYLLEQSASVRSDVGNLMSHLLAYGVLTTPQLLQGLKEVARAADGLGSDMPEVWLSLAEILASVVSAEVLSSSDMKTATTGLRKLVTTMLHLLLNEKGPDWMSQRWDLSGISWKDLVSADSEGRIAKENDPHQKVRALLNELRPENFHVLMQQLEDLIIDNSQQLPDLVDLVFEKAVSEPTKSAVYAQVCEALSDVRQRGGGEEGSPKFRGLLLRRCRHELENNWLAGEERDRRLAEMEPCTDPVEREKMQSEMERELRMKSVGFIRFVGELFKIGMLTQNVMHRYIQGLLKQRDEVSLECLCELLTAVGKRIDGTKHLKERGIEKEEEKEAGGEQVGGDNEQRSAGLSRGETADEKEGEAAEDTPPQPASTVPEQIHGEGHWSPHNPDGPKKYERDFLIRLRDTAAAKKKPEIRPDVLYFVLKDVSRRGVPDPSRGPHDNFTRTYTKPQSYQRDLSKYFEEMKILSKRSGQISSRVRFMLQNVIELRDNNWVPRRDDSTQKTIQQIRCKADRESTIEMQMPIGGGGGSRGVGHDNLGGDWRK